MLGELFGRKTRARLNVFEKLVEFGTEAGILLELERDQQSLQTEHEAFSTNGPRRGGDISAGELGMSRGELVELRANLCGRPIPLSDLAGRAVSPFVKFIF